MSNIAIKRVANTVNGSPKFKILYNDAGILREFKNQRNQCIYITGYADDAEMLKQAITKMQQLGYL